MTAGNQPQTTYTWDNANRLTGIHQGAANVTIAYDDAGRRTSVTLPNGVTEAYAYDQASRVTSITYIHPGGVGNDIPFPPYTMGDLTYAYDADGRRIEVGGSFARVNLPVAQAFTYRTDDALGGSFFSSDDAGNLVCAGSFCVPGSFTWNDRNQLKQASALTSTPPTFSVIDEKFHYDGFGRRVSREVKIGSGPWVTTTYLYDGLNPVQETSQGATTNMLTGLGLDEYFMRSEPSGTMSLLTDALGSTIALTDLNGDIQTEYTYGPFGATTESGVLSSNPYRFTGREWEPMGMYFMRERYIMPRWARFLSRDPMGFGAGSTNLYTYAGNSPTNFTDRLGLEVLGTIDIGVVSGGDGGGGPVKRSGAGGPCDGPCPSVGFVFPQVQGTLDKLRRQRGTNVQVVSPGSQASGSNPVGYVDFSATVGFGADAAFLGVIGGVFVSQSGVFVYGGGGVMTPGLSFSVTGSSSEPSAGPQVQLQGTGGLAGATGKSFGKGGGSFKEGGVGGPPGASATAAYVFGPFLGPLQ